MRIDAAQAGYRASERFLCSELPERLREPWRKARRDKIMRLSALPTGVVVPNAKKPVGLWAPATSVMVLSRTVAMDRMGGGLPTPRLVEDMDDPAVIEEILAGPLAGYSGPFRAMSLTQVGVFRSRVLGLNSSNLALAAKRVLASEPAIDRSERLRTYETYHRAALSLDPCMEPDEEHLLDTAIPCREAATAIIAVEVAPRQTELTGLHTEDIAIIGSNVEVIIPGRLSKTGTTQVRRLTPEGGQVVKEYCERARPYLLSMQDGSYVVRDELWIGEGGHALQAPGVLRAVNLKLARAVGAPVCNNTLRVAMASRSDLDDAEVGAFLGHSPLSELGPNHYANWDLAAAAADLRDVWAEFDPDRP